MNTVKPKDELNEPPVKQNRFPCRICQKSFTLQYNLSRHMGIVHDCVRFKCDNCDKTFEQQHLVKTHALMVHLGKPQFICTLCPMGHWRNTPNQFMKKFDMIAKLLESRSKTNITWKGVPFIRVLGYFTVHIVINNIRLLSA